MSVSTLSVPLADDFHTHLRQGALMRAVTPLLKPSGVGLAYVMPNLKPPISNTEQALAYKAELEALAPGVEFMMTLYLGPELTPDEIHKAAKAGVAGVKSYPRGVTTNSDSGIESYTTYYPVFKAMEENNMVLNLHGEIPSDPNNDVCVMNAEERFLTHLKELHRDFPKLKIVLEHATTKAAVEVVESLGETVGCTITLHHLTLVVDDWAGQCHHFCKPVAKFPHDREALRRVIKSGHPRFFLGTDSAPHPRHLKEGPSAAAGVFTGPHVLPYLAHILESFGALDQLRHFACENGRRFYGVAQASSESVAVLVREPFTIAKEIHFTDDEGQERALVPFMAGKTLNWRLQ
ncbi:uncharacterized protein BJ171DRAFT_462586 [Polychytrium aggregatum]|uniref:uncharacterized protein n=1 Tax=Polychytrium aggregatum TaxID=110093 RepID=UPI0022FF31D8|nr:uncharacterized protein BJ171DRAFT_462586 [Polychytrium aggregatum]KAI9199238.1 hypothetical protein BJ171DRAFT_462586 [Polychytrium aggregatum]